MTYERDHGQREAEVDRQAELARRLRETEGVSSVRQRRSGGKLYISVKWEKAGEYMITPAWRSDIQVGGSIRAAILDAFPAAQKTSASYGPIECAATWRLNP